MPDWRTICHFLQSGFEPNLAFGFFPDWAGFPSGLFFLIAPISSEVFSGDCCYLLAGSLYTIVFWEAFCQLGQVIATRVLRPIEQIPDWFRFDIQCPISPNARLRLARLVPDCFGSVKDLLFALVSWSFPFYSHTISTLNSFSFWT